MHKDSGGRNLEGLFVCVGFTTKRDLLNGVGEGWGGGNEGGVMGLEKGDWVHRNWDSELDVFCKVA